LIPSRLPRAPSRCASLLMLSSALCGGIARADTIGHGLPMRAVVHGHNVQPRNDQLKALGYFDLTPQEADEVDRLYQEIMHNTVTTNRTPS
jgi:hypothetical protein